MLEGIFKTVVSISIKTSIIALFIMVIRFTLGRKLPKNFSYYLWFIVLFRLIFPINFVSNLSLFNYVLESNVAIDKVIRDEVSKEAIRSIQTTPSIVTNKVSDTSLDTLNTGNSINSIEIFIKIIAFVWIVGVVFLILKAVIKYYRASKILELSNICNVNIGKIKDMIRLRKKVQIYTLKGIESPMVYKFLKPRIIIPNSMENELYKEETKHILAHELIHIKRQDNILKLVWFIVVSIHWFNPIIWLSVKLFNEDMELSCDERVMKIWENDIRRNYANLLIDIADKQIHPLEENFIGFGKTNIKTRVKNIMKYKRPKFWFTVFCIMLISLIIPMTLTNKDDKERIDLTLNYTSSFPNLKNISIKDKKIIDDIMSMIEKSETVEGKTKLEDMEKMNCEDNKLILTKTDGKKKEINFSFDNLYEFGYIEIGGKIKKPNYDFFRYMFDLMEYKKIHTNIEKQIVNLFKKYNWTVDYKINTLKEKLPDNLKHNAGEYPVKIYWAYNNELSKQIELDFTDYLGENITAEIYRLRESLPDFMEPMKDARGVVLKYNDKIIGAYIDVGRHNSFACSLDRMSLEDITGKDWNQWIENYINYDDQLEIKLSKMKPENIIKEYIKALDKNDTKMIWATITRKKLCGYLASNMDNHYLFNTEKEMSKTNIKSVKLLEIKRTHPSDEKEGEVTYEVVGDFKQHEKIVVDDGIDFNFYTLKKEVEKSGWRIDEIGK